MNELEITCLVKKLPKDWEKHPVLLIKQGYFSKKGASPLRIRQKGNYFSLTKKIPLKAGDFSQFEEKTIEITKEEFDRLWPSVVASLEKKRVLYKLDGGLTAEIDIFEGPLKGLVLVEVEFSSEEEKTSFKLPEWFGCDVTQEKWVAGKRLAGKSFAEIKPLLTKVRV